MFVADSGATKNIINMSLALRNFKKCSREVIKSANKNKQADILYGWQREFEFALCQYK